MAEVRLVQCSNNQHNITTGILKRIQIKYFISSVNMLNDENDKPRGAGILEFAEPALAKTAIEKMHRFDMKGRKIVVKEDFDAERDKFGRIVKGSDGGGGGGGRGDSSRR